MTVTIGHDIGLGVAITNAVFCGYNEYFRYFHFNSRDCIINLNRMAQYSGICYSKLFELGNVKSGHTTRVIFY